MIDKKEMFLHFRIKKFLHSWGLFLVIEIFMKIKIQT